MKFYQKQWFFWAMLIFIAPVGIFMLWTQKPYSKNTKKVLTIISASIFLMSFTGNHNKAVIPDTSSIETITAGNSMNVTDIPNMPTCTPTPTSAPLTLTEELNLVTQNFNVRNITDDGLKSKNIIINENPSLTNNMTKLNMLFEAKTIFEKSLTCKNIHEINMLTIQFALPLTDIYGKTSDNIVLSICMDTKVLEKINWSNFDQNNFKKVAAQYLEHPALNR